MTSMLRLLSLCGLLFPLAVHAQAPVPGAPLDLGLIPLGEERSFVLSGRLNIETATQDQGMAAVQRAAFSIPEAAGVCISAQVPADPTVLFLVGRAGDAQGPIVFDVNTGWGGLSGEDGRRTFAASVGPVEPTTFVLAAVVGQSMDAPGNTVMVVVRAYPDTTSEADVVALCGTPLGA